MKRKALAGLAVVTVLMLATIAPYIHNSPVVAQPPPDQRGPRIDTLQRKVTRSPDAQLIEMTMGPPDGSDVWTGLANPEHIEEMDRQCKTISSRSGFHYCRIALNMRQHPLDDVNFRHVLAHLVPKEKIIGTLFKYISIPISTPVPPAQGLWYNPYVDPHPYSRAEAEAILADAGYQFVDGEWKDKDGSDLPLLRFFVPLEIVSPTSYMIGNMTVEEALAIGLNNIVLEPMDFATYMDLTFNQWDFELSWVCHNLGRFPTHLWHQFHSVNNYMGSSNPHGIDYPELDAQLDILWNSLDHPAKVVATKEAQQLVMGGTTTDPLPHNVQATDPRYQAIPTVPVYSKTFYDIQQPDLSGAINMFGEGIDNIWTCMNIYWNTPNEYRPGTTEKTVVWIEEDFPERLNPLSASTVYAWDFMSPTFDGLIATNPYTQGDEPWLATSWSYEAEAGGMYIRYDLRTTDSVGNPVKWQDGEPIAPTDATFAWDFLHDHQIPRHWDVMQSYLYSDIVGNEITAHMSTTSQWTVYALAEVALMLPPQVWQPWVGQPTDEILAWDPSAEPGPGGLPTKVYGTGPFTLQHSTTDIVTQGYGDLDANRNYWMTTQEIMDEIEYLFWRAGDVNRDGVIDDTDIARIEDAYNSGPVDPNWDPDADITGPGGSPPDEWVGIDDLATATKYYGETREVAPGSKLSGPRVFVYPVTIIGPPPKINETFTVDVKITAVEDLYTWQAGMTFNATVLEALSIAEGEFLKRAGVPTLWTPGTINNELGQISYSACSLTGPTPGVSGSGQLMNITFKVKDNGVSELNLTDVLLLDSDLVEIPPVKITNGYVEINVQDIAILDVGIATNFTRYLYVNEYAPLFGEWALFGTEPYLDAPDDGSYTEGYQDGALSDWFGFEDVTLGPFDRIVNVKLEGYCKADSTDVDIDVYTYGPVDYAWLGSLWGDPTWSWKSPRWIGEDVSDVVPLTLTEAGLNDLGVVLYYYAPWEDPPGSEGPAAVDCLRLKVTIESLEPIDTKEVYPTWIVPLNIGVVVENQGTATETFDVSLFASTTAIETQPVTLTAGANTTVVFNWDLSGFPEGTYTMRTEASVLYGEIDTADNVLVDGTVRIKHPGDANGDGVLNAYDLGTLGQAWGTQVGDPLYDPRADFNGDGAIDNQDHDILKEYWP